MEWTYSLSYRNGPFIIISLMNVGYRIGIEMNGKVFCSPSGNPLHNKIGNPTMETLNIHIEGISPLIIHSGTTKNPLNDWTKALKELTKIRNKTDEIHQDISDTEWYAYLYTNPGIHPGAIIDDAKIILPSLHIEAAIRSGSKKIKMGKQFPAACFVEEDAELIFPDKGKSLSELHADPNYRLVTDCKVGGTSSVIRTRPYFPVWSLKFKMSINTDIMDIASVKQSIELCGQQCGMGTWRPKHGRFTILEVA